MEIRWLAKRLYLLWYNSRSNKRCCNVNLNFKEYIRSFTMVGNAVAAFNKISDQTGDPNYNSETRGPSNPWTEGNFDFKVKVLINKKNGTTETLDKGFILHPSTLFTVNYVQDRWFFGWVYKVSSVQLKTAIVSNTPLFTWDLNEMATQIKISFEEVDPSQTITESRTVTADIATNFEITAGLSEKVGTKFGATTKNTFSRTHTVVTQAGNDQLGNILVNFGEKVIRDQNGVAPAYNTLEHSTGYCSISLEPRQNQ